MYVDRDINVLQRYSAIIQYNYLADVEKLDFDNGRASSNSINGWIKTITNGRIKNLVSENLLENTPILLINAIFLEGIWQMPFTKILNAPFKQSNGLSTDKVFMERTGTYYYCYSKYLKSKILRIPYSGRRYSMYFILPDENQIMDGVVELLSSETIKNEIWHMDEAAVRVVIPKFRLDISLTLNEVIKKVKFTGPKVVSSLNFQS